MGFIQGQETYSIDEKGRVNIPSKMRKSISEDANNTFVVTRGLDNCVVAYPMDEWKNHQMRYQSLNQYDEKNRLFLRLLLSMNEEVTLDKQSRISIPKRLMDFAGLNSKVIIVGMIDHIEIWDPDKYEEYLSKYNEFSYEDAAKEVMAASSSLE